MKKLTGLILAFLFSLPCYATNIVATVNDTPISQWDLDNTARLLQLQQAAKYQEASPATLRKDALDSAIDTVLKKQKAASLKLQIAPQEIDNAIAHLENQNQMPAGTFYQMLQQNNISVKTLRNQIEADLLWLNYLRTQSQHINIAPASVNKRVQMVKDDLKKQGIEGDSMMLWELAEGILPEDVSPNAALESKDCEAFLDHIALASDTMRRGWTNPKDLPEELYTMLSEIAVGETLGPIKTPQGILLFMKCDIKSQRLPTSPEEIKQQMEMEQMEMLSARLLELERRHSAIEYK